MAAPRSTTITHVDNNYNGCFVACVGMLLGLSYSDAFKKVFPKRKGPHCNSGGGCAPQVAFKRLARLGLQPRMLNSNQNVLKLRQTSLIWLRWSPTSALMHSVVYEKESNLFHDPNYPYPLVDKIRLDNLNRFKENVIALDGYVPPPIRIIPPAPLLDNYNDYDLY